MLVAPSSPLTIGLTASPTSDAVVSRPKPAPLAPAGMMPLAAVYEAVVAAPIATPKMAVGSASHQALPTIRKPATPQPATAQAVAMTRRAPPRRRSLPHR
jgi:hypothetical protein